MSSDNGHIERHLVEEAQLDHVIDAVAREMTEGEPSGALRARVLGRIEQERRRPALAVPRWAWAGAAAAGVMAVATVIWMTGTVPGSRDAGPAVAEQRSSAPSPSPADVERQATQAAALGPEAAGATSRLAAVVRPGRRVASRVTRAADANAADDANLLPELADIEPLRFSTVAPNPLHVAAVDVAPLPVMTPLDIANLDPGSNDMQSADPKKEN